jgi:hypothetical protein
LPAPPVPLAALSLRGERVLRNADKAREHGAYDRRRIMRRNANEDPDQEKHDHVIAHMSSVCSERSARRIIR